MAVLQRTMSAKSEPKPRERMNVRGGASAAAAKKTILVAQDVRFAKTLACNDKRLRDRALKRLKKWFEQRESALPFTEEDFMRIWKGLFYSMWMSDKPLVQEECAENIARLVHFNDVDSSLLFFKCGLCTLMQEWFGIDQLRLDKFLMFTRRLLRQGFVILKNYDWKKGPVTKFADVLTGSILRHNVENVLGLKMHFFDIYLEELAKVSQGKVSPFTVSQLLLPFVKYLAVLEDHREINHIKQNVFRYLMRQSDKGIEFEKRYAAWRKTRFAGGTINSVIKQYVAPEERIPDLEEVENGDEPLDPRAGNVNVELPQLKFSVKDIVQMLEEHKFVQGSTTKSKKAIGKLVNDFNDFAKGNYPLVPKRLVLPENDNYSTKLKDSVKRLAKFENKLMGIDRKQRKRKREADEPSEAPARKKKKSKDSSKSEDHDFFQRKLEEFMERSERKLKKSKKLKRGNFEVQNLELSGIKSTFRRNSGTWYVSNAVEKPSLSSPPVVKDIPAEPSDIDQTTDDTEEDIPDVDLDELEEEYEIIIPSRRRKVKELNEKLKQETSNSLSKPTSAKKVKIALDLNKSQEFHEHEMQILKSPAIPFDTNKKPLKPLLKPSPVSSPINPFYRKKRLFVAGF